MKYLKVYFKLIRLVIYVFSLILLFSFVFVIGDPNNIVIQESYSKNNVKSVVSKSGNVDTTLSDLDDIFFEIIYPEDLKFTYRSRMAKEFGSYFSKTYENVPLVLVDPLNACGPIRNSKEIIGKVAFTIRGDCSFVTKTINVENAGAGVAIIADNDPVNENLIDMINDDTGRITNIPALFVQWKDGYMIKNSLETQKLKYAIINIPLNLTFKSQLSLKKAPWSHS